MQVRVVAHQEYRRSKTSEAQSPSRQSTKPQTMSREPLMLFDMARSTWAQTPSSGRATRRVESHHLHAYEIFPRIAARLAPVADGILEARRCHVSYARRAKAAASFAALGNPNSFAKR